MNEEVETGYSCPKGYKQTEVGVIPEDWCIKKIGDVCGCIVPGRNKPSDFDGEIPWITTPDLEDGRSVSVSRNGLCISREEAQQIGSKVVPVGAVLMSCAGDLGITVITCNEIVINQQLHAFIPSLQVNALFLLNVIKYQKHQIGNLATKTAVPYLNKNNCNSILIPFPSVNEQEAIAEALSDADALIESLEQLLVKKCLIKQGAMQELFRPKSSYEVRLLGEVSSLNGRIGWQGLKQIEFTTNDDDPFLITGMNFKDGAIRWSEVYHISESRYAMAPEIQLQPNDVLMTKDGTIGKVLYINKIPYPGKASINSHLILFRPIGIGYNPKYLYYQLSSRRFKDFVEQSKSGTTFFGLSQAAIATYPLLLPPLTEQARTARVLSDIDSEIEVLEDKLNKARHIKQGMMQELLTGRIRLVES